MGRLGGLLHERAAEFEDVIEWRVRLRKGKWFVPDVAVQRRDAIQDPHAMLPIYLCAEILSPEERIGEMLKKGEASMTGACRIFGWWTRKRGRLGAMRRASIQ